ncbi:MAG: hypothetical protein ACAF41_13060 [Leptolyngbya sp. BL-A-14]
MSDYYCTISVEKSDVEAVKSIIERKIGKASFDICIEVEDRKEIYSYTSNFMRENKLQEANSILRALDLRYFTVDIDLYCTEDSFGLRFLDIVADAIGGLISEVLDTRTLVTLVNQESPFCIFNCGKREQVFTEQNKQYFDGKFWLPSTLKSA